MTTKGNVKFLVIGGILIALGGSYLIFRKKINAWVEKKFSGKKDETKDVKETVTKGTEFDTAIITSNSTNELTPDQVSDKITEATGININIINGFAVAKRRMWLAAINAKTSLFKFEGKYYDTNTGNVKY